MAEELRAIPNVLLHVGNQLADHGESLLDLQRACHRDAGDARPGWVGSSAGELSGLLERWATVSAGQSSRLGAHSSGMRMSAVELAELERSNALSLR